MTPIRTRVPGGLVLGTLTLLSLNACTGSDAGPVAPEPDPPGTVGTKGGAVSATGGAATVSIPAGALASNVQVTITPTSAPPADPNLVAGTSWTFGPSGTQFAAPVQMTLKYDESRIPDGLPESALHIAKNVGGTWQRIPGDITVNPGAKTVTGSVMSFSDYTVMADPCAARAISPGQTVSGSFRAGDCIYGAAGANPQYEDLFEIQVTQTTALFLTLTTDGPRPTVGVKEKTASIDDGVVYAFRSGAADATGSRLEVILAPGTYHVWAGSVGNLATGSYQLAVESVPGDNRLGCRAYFVRPPLDMQQEIGGATDCIQKITVSPDPALIGQEIAEEYYYVRVQPGQTLTVTTTRVGGDSAFQPFPTIFTPNGGAVQDADASAGVRTVQFAATGSGYILIGVSSAFDRHPSDGGRYTQGTYRLQIALQ
ncbi:MAG: hypothetical protein ACYC6F_01895 [Longimicrobiales bacterium]